MIIYKLIVIVFLLVILQNNKVHGTFIKLKFVRISADKLPTSAEETQLRHQHGSDWRKCEAAVVFATALVGLPEELLDA